MLRCKVHNLINKFKMSENQDQKKEYTWAETNIVLPINGHKLMETTKTWFDNESGITIWKNIAGHDITEDELVSMLNWEEVWPFNLNKKDWGTFSAKLKFDTEQKKVAFAFNSTPATESSYKCPISKENLKENEKSLFCKESNFTLWKVQFQHKLTEKEISTLLSGWTTDEITDFVSTKTGKTFSAKLKLNPEDNYKSVLEFAPRS